MRLINADALIERIIKTTCVPCREKGGDYKGVKCRACQYGDEIDDIESAPTIERKTGKWIGHAIWKGVSIDKDVCSECGHRFYQLAETGDVWNYCPNCGAKMKGVEVCD